MTQLVSVWFLIRPSSPVFTSRLLQWSRILVNSLGFLSRARRIFLRTLIRFHTFRLKLLISLGVPLEILVMLVLPNPKALMWIETQHRNGAWLHSSPCLFCEAFPRIVEQYWLNAHVLWWEFLSVSIGFWPDWKLTFRVGGLLVIKEFLLCAFLIFRRNVRRLSRWPSLSSARSWLSRTVSVDVLTLRWFYRSCFSWIIVDFPIVRWISQQCFRFFCIPLCP